MDFPHLDVIDLPSDLDGALGQTRTMLLRTYNANRTNPRKLQLFLETMQVVSNTIKEGFLAVAESEKTPAMKAQEKIDSEFMVARVEASNNRAAKRPQKDTK